MKLLCLYLVFNAITATGFCQTNNTKDGRFHDDLLEHLVGKWHDTATAHGSVFTSEVEVKWVLNHQYLLLHLRSNEIVPWWGTEMEYYQYIGYNHKKNRYTIHGMSIEGDQDLSEGFSYGFKENDVVKTVAKFSDTKNIIQRYFWNASTDSWLIESRNEEDGVESEVFLNMKLTRAK